MPRSRFDYVKYDETANAQQSVFKEKVIELEHQIELSLAASPNAKDLALRKLEEVYMWIGKGIRDSQLVRDSKTQLQEERKNG